MPRGTAMRFFFLLVLLAGLAGAAYPFVAGRLGGGAKEIASFRVYEPVSGFRSVSIPLVPDQAPVAVILDLAMHNAATPDARLSSATVTASRNGRTLIAAPVTFRDSPARTGTEENTRSFRASAGTIETVEDGTYTFTVARGEAEIPQVTAIDLVLRHAPAIDARIQPLGFALAAVGFIALVLAIARRPAATSTAGPPKPRWGRTGDA